MSERDLQRELKAYKKRVNRELKSLKDHTRKYTNNNYLSKLGATKGDTNYPLYQGLVEDMAARTKFLNKQLGFLEENPAATILEDLLERKAAHMVSCNGYITGKVNDLIELLESIRTITELLPLNIE